MRMLLVLSALLGAAAFGATNADAQLPPGIIAGRDLQNKDVQGELKITGEQKAKVSEMMRGAGLKLLAAHKDSKDLPLEERTEIGQKVSKEVSEAIQKEINEILTPEQAKRFKQIERQQRIPSALVDEEEVQKALNLDEQQITKVKTIKDESRKEISQFELTQSKLKANPFETQQKVATLEKDANAQALRVLTDEQKIKWKELVGEPFEVKISGFGLGKKN
jgi:Spy/CpxP family protein refolding chaperone